MNKVGEIFAAGCMTIIVATLIGTVLLWWAWNAFMPEVFGLRQIDLLQAFALSIMLSSIGRVQINSGR